MSKSLNQCNFIGRMGQNPEVKHMPSGDAVCNFSIAVSDDYKDKSSGELVEKTEWVRVVQFGKSAEVVGEYCKKGSLVFVTGKFTTRKWQNQDGQNQYTTEIKANSVQFLDPVSGAGDRQAPQPSAPQQQPAPSFEDFDDELPPF